jgi:hypothetical protein
MRMPPMNFELDVLRTANMTRTQLTMWTGQMLSGKRPIYNMGFKIGIESCLDEQLFRESFDYVVRQSDILRSTFRYVQGGPQRVVLPPGEIEYEIPVLDFSNRVEDLDGWLQDKLKLPIDMKKRLFDTALIRTGPKSWVWYLCQHHLICDGWSTANFAAAVGDRYAQLEAGDSSGLELPRFGDFVAREFAYYFSDECKESGKYWTHVAQDVLPDLKMYGIGADAGTTAFLRVHRPLSGNVIDSMKQSIKSKVFRAFSLDQGLFLLMLTALVLQLKRASGNDKFAIGICLHHRRTLPDKKCIGPFFIFSAMHVKIEQGDNFSTLYDRVSQAYRDMLRHYRHPVLASPGERVWDVTINFVNRTFPLFAGRATTITWLQSGSYLAQEFIGLQIHPFNKGDGMTAEWDFNLGIFRDPDQRETAMQDFESALLFGMEHSDRPLAEFF